MMSRGNTVSIRQVADTYGIVVCQLLIEDHKNANSLLIACGEAMRRRAEEFTADKHLLQAALEPPLYAEVLAACGTNLYAPGYVPALLERIRTGVGDNIRKRGGAQQASCARPHRNLNT
jgi:hypothetical protein